MHIHLRYIAQIYYVFMIQYDVVRSVTSHYDVIQCRWLFMSPQDTEQMDMIPYVTLGPNT